MNILKQYYNNYNIHYNIDAEDRCTSMKLYETNTCKKSYRLLQFYVYSSKKRTNKYVNILNKHNVCRWRCAIYCSV